MGLFNLEAFRKMNSKVFSAFVKKGVVIFMVGLLFHSINGFAQTNPSLEMNTGDGNPTGNGPVLSTTIQFRKNTDNPSGNTFASYSPTINVAYSISNSQYVTSVNNSTVNIGFDAGVAAAIFPFMNAHGSPANANFTSTGATSGNGITVAANSAVRFNVLTYPLRVKAKATNGTYAMADLTVTFNRAVNNPIIHIGGLGGTSDVGLGYATRFELVNSNVPLSNISLTRLSGNNSTGFQVAGLAVFNGASSIAGTGNSSGSGSVQINGNGITSLTFSLYIRGDGAVAQTTAWASSDTDTGSGDSFTVGFSIAESDLAVSKTVNNLTPTIASFVQFTVVAKNNGASNNTGVSVTDLMPTGFAYVSSSATIGAYNSTTGLWSIGNLADGASATLTIIATVNASGSYQNTATISSSSGINDPSTVNNQASVNVTPVVIDSDGDGYNDFIDLDDDNDGILDTEENNCSSSSKTESTPIYINDFGTGAPTTDPFVLNHVFDATNPNDGFYAVTTSNDQTQFYAQTNLTGNKDAGNPTITAGSTTGRYLMINIDSPNNTNKAIYRVSGIPTVIGQSYRFRIDMAGLHTNASQVPSLEVSITDNSNNELGFATSASLGMANDDVWRRLSMEFIATTTTVNLEIVNLQPTGNSGNDVGIDNIIFAPTYCDTDNDGIFDVVDLDSDGDGCYDAIEGDENVTTSQLSSGRISGVVNSNGVPNLVNSGGAADIGGDQGQGIGSTKNSATKEAALINSQPMASQTVCQNITATVISVTASGSPVLTYQWYSNTSNSNSGGTLLGGATNSTYMPTTSSSGILYYYVVVTGPCGTATSTVSTVNVNALPSSSVSATNVKCFGGSDGKIVVTGSGGSGSYQYSINNGGTYTPAQAGPYTFSGLTFGVYQIKVKDNNGCVSNQ